MTAYVIAIRETPVTDPAAMAEYSRLNRAAAAAWQAAFGLMPLVVYGQSEAPEGANPDGIVIVSFPTIEQARAWYASPNTRPRCRCASRRRSGGW
jgi:uncharacterized protein (DUF1330 family)